MKKILVVLSTLFAISCSNRQDNSDKYKLTESDDVIKLEISSDVNLYEICIRYYEEDGKEYITLTRKLPKEIYDEIVFYDLETRKESHAVRVYKEGPNAINGGLFGYDIINMDSIVLTSRFLPYLYYINGQGIMTKVVAIGEDKGKTESLMLSIVNQPYVIVGDIVDYPQDVPYTRNSNVPNHKDFKFTDCPLSYLINIKTGEIEASEAMFPHLYDNDNNINHNENYSRVFDGENYVYSFYCYDSLVVSHNHEKTKCYYAKSKYIEEVRNEGTPKGASNEDLDLSAKGASYGNIVYDRERNVFYRFCYFTEDKEGSYTLERALSRDAFTIMTIDSDFNVVGETVFPAGKYAPRMCFINKDGLWLSENNYKRTDMTDDELVFRCLKLEEVK